MATGTTDANGNAIFTNVAAGSHPLSISAAGFQTLNTSINVTASGTFTFTLTPVGGLTYTVTIHVQDQSGAPVPQASVALT